MARPLPDFAHYCCELLASVGSCVAKPMFGGFGLSLDGLTIALVVDLGGGEKLWLKASETTRQQYEAAGCERFTYLAKGVPRSVNYYAAPDEAMESPELMRPWAQLALQCALSARKAGPVPAKRTRPAAKSAAKPPKPQTTPTARRAKAAPTSPRPARTSRKG